MNSLNSFFPSLYVCLFYQQAIFATNSHNIIIVRIERTVKFKFVHAHLSN